MGLDFGRLGRPAELSAFCAIAAHVHGDENIGREYHPLQAEEKKDAEFVKVKNDLGLSDSDVLSMISKFNSTNEDQNPSFNYHQFEKRNDYWGL